jgi:hypothetical protein
MKFHNPKIEFRKPGRNHLFYIWLILGLVCCYMAVTNPGYMDISDAEERFTSIRMLLDTGSPAINTYFQPAPFMPIYSIGPAISALPFFGWAEILLAWWSHVPYRQVMLWAALFSVKFYTAAWMAVVAAIAFHFTPSRRLALAVALASGLCTLVLPYSRSFQSENLAGLGVACIILGFLRFRRYRSWRWLAFAGFSYGMLLTIKLETAVAVPLFAAWLGFVCWKGDHTFGTRFRQWMRSGIVIAVSMLPGIVLILLYNKLRFGSSWISGYESQGFTHPFLSGLYLQWLSAGKGLLWYCPILLFTMYYSRKWLRQFGPDAWLPALWWILMTCLYAKWHSPTGETSLGSRFMVSYLPIGVLPITALGRMGWSRLRRTGFSLMAIFSFVLSVFLSSVPFVLYHSRRWNNSPNNIVDRMRAVFEDWYVPAYSPLKGMQGIFKERIFDLFYLRDMPLEQHLLVYPMLWYWLAGAAGLLGLAWIEAGKLDFISYERPMPGRTASFRGGAVLLVVGLFVLGGLSRTGGERHRGFDVEFSRPLWAIYHTRSQAIDVKDFQESPAFHIMGGADFSATYTGTFRVHQAGNYQFRLDTSNIANLEIDGQRVTALHNLPYRAKPPVVGEIALSQGVHHLRLYYYQYGVWGGLQLKWKNAKDAIFKSMRNADPQGE